MKQKASWGGLKRFITVVGDVVVFNASVLIAFYLRFGRAIPIRNFYTYEKSVVWLTVVFLLVNFLLGAYVYYNRRVSDIIFITILGQVLTIMGLIMITFLGRLFAFPRSVLLLSFVVSAITLSIYRVIIFFLYLRLTPSQRVAVVSHVEDLPAVIQNFNSAKNNKHKVDVVVTDHFVENVKNVLPDVDVFYLTKDISDDDRRAIVDLVLKANKHLMFPSTFDNLLMLRPNLMNFEDESVMGISDFRLSSENAFFKRVFDIIVALLLLIVASPFMLVTAILVKVTSPGLSFTSRHGSRSINANFQFTSSAQCVMMPKSRVGQC